MGYIQNQIIKIGKEKGFVTNLDLARFYQVSKIVMEMNKLIAKGIFEESKDCGSHIKWNFKIKKLEVLKVASSDDCMGCGK